MKHKNNYAGFALIALMAVILAACATFKAPQTFNERLAAGYVSTTSVRQVATILLNGRVISSADAENVQRQADVAREGLDLASTLQGALAEDKLTSTLQVLHALEAYLASKQKELSK